MTRSGLNELILFITAEQEAPLDAQKLGYLVFYADMRAYRKLGASLTGTEYLHGKDGPEAVEVVEALSGLVANDSLGCEVSRESGRMFVTCASSSRVPYSPEQQHVIRGVLRDFGGMSTDEIKTQITREWGWKLTAENETIPYSASWLSAEALTPGQVAAGRRLWEDRAD